MKLYVLGTGNGWALDCYNTCFALENSGEYLLVDGGGGNQILSQLQKANINLTDIKNIFVTHNHSDHILGIIWVIRIMALIARDDETYRNKVNIYASDETISPLKTFFGIILVGKSYQPFLENQLVFNEIHDRQKQKLLNTEFEFIDIQARKIKQFGFICKLKKGNLFFAGDETLSDKLYEKAKNSKWLLHEVFCLDDDPARSKMRGHAVMSEVAKLAKELDLENLLLWHTDDKNLDTRKQRYIEQAQKYYNGNIFVPNDLEVIDLGASI